MSEESKELNAALRQVRTLILSMPPCPERDAMQARFTLVLDRIAQVPDRVLAQYDAHTIADGVELADVYREEMLWALDGWET